MLRLLTIADYEEVYQLWLKTPGMGLNDIDDSRDGIARFLKRNPTTCFVAELNGEIVGVIMAGHDGRRGYIYHTCVDPSLQKQGLGRQLVAACLTALKKEGISKVALVVFSRNISGNAFWEKCGFTTREDIVYRNLALEVIQRLDT